MVWFQCEDCGDTLKKPKVRGHASQCSASRFSCVDCLQVFDAYTVQQHTSCVTEHEKYALSITKPGQEHLMSAAANKEQGGGGPAGGGGGAVVGEDFLSKSPPYECACCKVKCTSWETLVGHAQGKKHKSKSRSAYAAQGKGPDGKPLPKEEEKKEEEEQEAAAKKAEDDADAGAGGGEENAADESPVKDKKEKKEKKRKRDKEDKSPKKEKKEKKAKKEKKEKKEKK